MGLRPVKVLDALVIGMMGFWTACAPQQAPPSKAESEVVRKAAELKPKGPDFFSAALALGGDREAYLIWASGGWRGRDADIHFTRSEDGGRTWVDVVSLRPDSSRNTGGRQILAGVNGHVYALWGSGLRTGNNEAFFTRSEDRGVTWTAPVSILLRLVEGVRGSDYAPMR